MPFERLITCPEILEGQEKRNREILMLQMFVYFATRFAIFD